MPSPTGQRRLRDQLVQIAMSGQHLDRDGLQTILADRRRARMSGAVRCGFLSPRRQQAGGRPSDLGAALEAVIARTEIEAALKRRRSPGAGFQRFGLCRAAAADRGEEELQRQAGVSRQQRVSGGPNGENDTTETETETGDAPLIDLNDVAIKKLIARAKKGVITYDELNEALPPTR